jgi:predicted nucleic-acid-binding protein
VGRGAAPDPPRARGASALTAFVDTDVVIRHLTGDPPQMAKRATAVLASGERLLLADLVLAECVYVLESYQAEVTGVDEIVSFDRTIDRIGSITRREP